MFIIVHSFCGLMIRKKLHWPVCLRFYHEVADKISAGLQLSEGLTGTGTSDCKMANTHSEELVTSRRSQVFSMWTSPQDILSIFLTWQLASP